MNGQNEWGHSLTAGCLWEKGSTAHNSQTYHVRFKRHVLLYYVYITFNQQYSKRNASSQMLLSLHSVFYGEDRLANISSRSAAEEPGYQQVDTDMFIYVVIMDISSTLEQASSGHLRNSALLVLVTWLVLALIDQQQTKSKISSAKTLELKYLCTCSRRPVNLAHNYKLQVGLYCSALQITPD